MGMILVSGGLCALLISLIAASMPTIRSLESILPDYQPVEQYA